LIRATIDTNVVVSGLLFGGVPLKILEASFERRFTWVTSPDLLVELDTVLRQRKFSLSAQEIKELTEPVLDVVEIVVPSKRLTVIKRCDADNRVLECAVQGRSALIVSGDRRDLLSLKQFRGVDIVSPREFFDRLASI